MRRVWWKLPVTGLLCVGCFWSAASADPRSSKKMKPAPARVTQAPQKRVPTPKDPDLAEESASSEVAENKLRTGLMPPEEQLPRDSVATQDQGETDAIIDQLLASEGLSPVNTKENLRPTPRPRSNIIPVRAEIAADEYVPNATDFRRKARPVAVKPARTTATKPAKTSSDQRAPRRMSSSVHVQAKPVAEPVATPLSSAAPRNAKRVPEREEVQAPAAGEVILPISGNRLDEHVIPADYNSPFDEESGVKPVSEIELAGHQQRTASKKASPIPTSEDARRLRPKIRLAGNKGAAPAIGGAEEFPILDPAGETSNDLVDIAPPPPARRAVRRVKQTSANPAIVEERGALVQAVSRTPQTPSIRLRWITDGEVNVGQQCKCGLVVKNEGDSDAHDIIVEATFPKTVRVLETNPSPRIVRDKLAWKFADFPAGEERTIEITMIPYKKGELATSASVRFTGTASTVLRVEEPELAVALKGPQEAMIGETIAQVLSITNTGSGVAHEVVVHAALPPGLEHPRGKRLEMPVGTLGAGETREVRLSLTATVGGEQQILVEARSGQTLVRQAETTIQVTAPKLKATIAGPTLRYVDRQAAYVVTVSNVGTVATDNVRVQLQISPAFEFVKAERGARHDWSTRQVTWFLGRMEPGQSSELPVTLVARQGGTHHHDVTVTDEVGGTSEGTVETRVESTSALVMEVVDLDDPVEVGTETAYEIRIRNDGSKAAQDLNLSFEIPTGVELLETQGPTTARRAKGGIVFKPLESLGAKQKVAYRVFVTGRQAGNLRCRAKLLTGSSTDPLIVEEQTKFYAD